MTIEMLKRAVEVGGEAALINLFRSQASTGKRFEDRLPFNPSVDTMVCDFDLLYGRADLVLTHADGSLTVVIVKDGARGHDHVAAGIGAASLCGAQFAVVRPSVEIRKALLWASTGDLWLDAILEDACTAAAVIPLPWATVALHLTETAACVDRGLTAAARIVHPQARGVH